LVVIGTEGEKRGETLWYISPQCPDNPSYPIKTKLGEVGDMVEVIKTAKFGFDQLIDVGCVTS
jgi:hypothetical protein